MTPSSNEDQLIKAFTQMLEKQFSDGNSCCEHDYCDNYADIDTEPIVKLLKNYTPDARLERLVLEARIDEMAVKAIVAGYKSFVIRHIEKELADLDAKYDDGNVVLARRAALRQIGFWVKDTPWSKPYISQSVPPITKLKEN